MPWSPTPFNLLNGIPFQYSAETVSATDAFKTGIDVRDGQRCIVCGNQNHINLQHCHIIPQGKDHTWQTMKQLGFVPQASKSAAHETRNGILMCPNHHLSFDNFQFYIRWVPKQRLFVFINHSQLEDLEPYHGKAINIDPDGHRVPFHGAFLFHEMRVRGFWPVNENRLIPSLIPRMPWIGSGAHNGRGRGNRGRGNRNGSGPSGVRHLRSSGPVTGSSASGKMFILSDPFANPATLQALKDSFAEQPTWKAAVLEGNTWEGDADENATKWRRLNRKDA